MNRRYQNQFIPSLLIQWCQDTGPWSEKIRNCISHWTKIRQFRDLRLGSSKMAPTCVWSQKIIYLQSFHYFTYVGSYSRTVKFDWIAWRTNFQFILVRGKNKQNQSLKFWSDTRFSHIGTSLIHELSSPGPVSQVKGNCCNVGREELA